MPSARYPLSGRILHWLSAVVIIWACLSGFSLAMGLLSKQQAHWVADFNVSVTLLFIPLFILRAMLICYRGKPGTPQLSRRQQQLAHRAHLALYLCIALVLASGVLMMERPMPVFGLTQIEPLLSPSWLTALFAVVHRYSCVVLALLVILHLAAVVRHQMKGVALLRKML